MIKLSDAAKDMDPVSHDTGQTVLILVLLPETQIFSQFLYCRVTRGEILWNTSLD